MQSYSFDFMICKKGVLFEGHYKTNMLTYRTSIFKSFFRLLLSDLQVEVVRNAFRRSAPVIHLTKKEMILRAEEP